MSQSHTDQETPRLPEILDENLARIKHRIMVLSGKGGVGKSTFSVNLSYGLALSGKSVGILDADLHGPSVAKMLGIEGQYPPIREEDNRPQPLKLHDNLFALSLASLMPSADEPVIWRGPMKMGVLRQFLAEIAWPEIDYMVVDCPPGTGDEPLSMVQMLGKVDGVVIITTPQDVAYLDARKTIAFANQLGVKVLGLVENMAPFPCPHCGELIDLFAGNNADRTAEDFGIEVLGKIPFDPNVVKSGDKGRPYIYDFGKMNAAKEMHGIIERIVTQIETTD